MEGSKSRKSVAIATGGLLCGCVGFALYPHLGALALLLALSPATLLALKRERAKASELRSASRMMLGHDPSLYWHGCRTATYAAVIAREMGFRSSQVRKIHKAALLHDIGKIAIDKSLLCRVGPLSPEEFEVVKQHSEIGETMVAQWESTRAFSSWIRHHHERVDGGGYPDGIGDQEIPIESKIIAVADAYDAMVGANCTGDSHPYRLKRHRDDAVAEIVHCSGTQFDPEVVRAFQSALALGETMHVVEERVVVR